MIGSGILGFVFGVGILGVGILDVGILGVVGINLDFLGFFLGFLGFSRGFDIGFIITLLGVVDPFRAPKIITTIIIKNKQ